MIHILKWLIAIDLLLIALSLGLGGMVWLINTQIGYLSSALVLGASMFSYSQMVYRRVAEGSAVPQNDRDELDKMEDPYDLYGEEEPVESTQALKEAIKEEKQRMKQQRRTAYQTLKDSRASLSLMRLGAYLLLFVGFFYLSRNQLLHIPSYLLALTLPVIVIVGLLLTQKGKADETGL